MHLGNLRNEYAAKLGLIFDECPKAVLAAIAMSYFINHEAWQDDPVTGFCAEWETLSQNGIVPQKPGKLARQQLIQYREKIK